MTVGAGMVLISLPDPADLMAVFLYGLFMILAGFVYVKATAEKTESDSGKYKRYRKASKRRSKHYTEKMKEIAGTSMSFDERGLLDQEEILMSYADIDLVVVTEDIYFIFNNNTMLPFFKKDLVEVTNWLRTPGNLADLIISDATISQPNGHEFIRQIRPDSAAIYPLVILLAEDDDLNEKIAGFEAGADDYLVKPVNAAELNMRVRALLARTQALWPAVDSQTG